MTRTLVTYDLIEPGQDYERLYDALEKMRFERALESVWMADTQETVAAIRDALMQYLDQNDSLFVCRVGTSAWHNLPPGWDEWIKGHA